MKGWGRVGGGHHKQTAGLHPQAAGRQHTQVCVCVKTGAGTCCRVTCYPFAKTGENCRLKVKVEPLCRPLVVGRMAAGEGVITSIFLFRY